MVCVRAAWLTLPNKRVDLEGPGWFCSSLDLGSPTVRENVNNRSDNSGTIDRTEYLGSRVVSADITAIESAGGRIDEIAASFGPFMDPSQRPTLHYVLDRGTNPERTLVLRGAAYSWPIAGADQRDVQLQWVAPDPLALDPVQRVAGAWVQAFGAGRVYPLTFNRTYPAGAGGSQTVHIVTAGDAFVRPILRIYGPLSAPVVTFKPDSTPTDPTTYGVVPFTNSLVLTAGQYVTVDTDAHRAYMFENPDQSVLTALDWPTLAWPVLQPTDGYVMSISAAGNATPSSQVQASWYDRYFV